jgi:predicted DNA repair protein MutK
VQLEKDKIKGAIRTDFILSAEIIAITLGTVQNTSLTTQITVLTSIAILMTVGVYGLVAGIVKIDDLGLHLTEQHRAGSFKHRFGRGILWFAPYMMRGLSIVGTAAMFLVGGGILTHGFPAIHHWVEGFTSGRNSFVTSLISIGTDALTGILVGAAVLVVITVFNRLRQSR